MHLYLSYSGTVIEILFPTAETLKLTSEQIANLEQNFGRRIDVTVAYTELEANDAKYRYEKVEDAIDYLERLVKQSEDDKQSAISMLSEVLDQCNIKYRRTNDLIDFNDRFANLDYFFSIKVNEGCKSIEVDYSCESLEDLDSRVYGSIDDVIKDLLKLKELDTKFKSLVEDAPFNLDRSKQKE